LTADGLLAIAIQHENDHLQGKLMIDHLGLIKRRIVHRQLTKGD
jgi:peptide deformylase